MTQIFIELNGEKKLLTSNCDLQTAIESWQLSGKQFAIAVNEYFIPKSNYIDTILTDGDRVELVVPIQGG